ncbi:DUF2637 domain-containing protein [Streptomyces stelliscabiei]|uniref:DUF2637 domain-containing protein n=1 Tax=Streptomyces stelliscabiei TaxID=146820 RepID=UPI002FF08F39
MTTPPGDRPTLTRLQRRLIVGVGVGAAAIAAIGFIGSYAAVRRLAQAKGFGTFAHAFPIGIDAGILVLLALDLLLTWLRIPFPLLRHTAWLLTAATISFNAAAAWPDPVGTGMHATIPVLFVVVVEAARHAIGRTADITAGRDMDSVRLSRWFLDPVSTFRLWRRMKLWELRSYEEVIHLEQSRLIERARLRARYGRRWRSKAPVSPVLALRLTRYGRALAPVAGVLDIEHAPAHTMAAVGAAAEPAGTLGSAPALPQLPPASREPVGEPVSPACVSREPDGPAHEPRPEPGPRVQPAQSFGEHAAAAIEITLPTPPAEPPAHPAPGEPSLEPDREPTPLPSCTDDPATGEAVLAGLRAFAQDSSEPVSPAADPIQQPARAVALKPAHAVLLDQVEADEAWLAIKDFARRAASGPAHTAEPTPPREPQACEPVSRPVSPEPSREPSGEPAGEPEPSREPDPEPTGDPGSNGGDEIGQQILTLASRLRNGDEFTKTTAAELLGVSEATAGRRLKAARIRVGKGTGFYP